MRKKTPREPRESAIASGWTVEADPVAEIVPLETPADIEIESVGDEEGAQAQPRFSNAALVLLGVFGGLYLLYAWIWLSWAQYYAASNAESAAASGALGGALLQLVFWLAPLAPLLWFLAALLMNYDRGMRRLVFWVVLGAIITLPLPVFGGAGF